MGSGQLRIACTGQTGVDCTGQVRGCKGHVGGCSGQVLTGGVGCKGVLLTGDGVGVVMTGPCTKGGRVGTIGGLDTSGGCVGVGVGVTG